MLTLIDEHLDTATPNPFIEVPVISGRELAPGQQGEEEELLSGAEGRLLCGALWRTDSCSID